MHESLRLSLDRHFFERIQKLRGEREESRLVNDAAGKVYKQFLDPIRRANESAHINVALPHIPEDFFELLTSSEKKRILDTPGVYFGQVPEGLPTLDLGVLPVLDVGSGNFESLDSPSLAWPPITSLFLSQVGCRVFCIDEAFRAEQPAPFFYLAQNITADNIEAAFANTFVGSDQTQVRLEKGNVGVVMSFNLVGNSPTSYFDPELAEKLFIAAQDYVVPGGLIILDYNPRARNLPTKKYSVKSYELDYEASKHTVWQKSISTGEPQLLDAGHWL